MDALNSVSSSSSKTVRGWRGFGVIALTGINSNVAPGTSTKSGCSPVLAVFLPFAEGVFSETSFFWLAPPVAFSAVSGKYTSTGRWERGVVVSTPPGINAPRPRPSPLRFSLITWPPRRQRQFLSLLLNKKVLHWSAGHRSSRFAHNWAPRKSALNAESLFQASLGGSAHEPLPQPRVPD